METLVKVYTGGKCRECQCRRHSCDKCKETYFKDDILIGNAPEWAVCDTCGLQNYETLPKEDLK